MNRHIRARLMVEALEPRRLLAADLLDNVPVTADPDVQQQPSIAVNPLAAGHIATAYTGRSLVDTGYAGIAVAVSRDGGQTWQRSSIPLPAGFDQGATNPIAKFDRQGRLFVSFTAVTFLGEQPPITNPSGVIPTQGTQFRTAGFRSNNGIFVARSDDGGATFNAPATVASHTYDGQTAVPFDIMPDLAVDNYATLPSGSPNPNFGNLYVVWSRYYPPGQFPGEPESTGGSALQVAVSTDDGATWEHRLPAPTADRPVPFSVIRDSYFSGIGPPPGLGAANWAHAEVGPEGDVYVSYYDFGYFAVAHSTDAARTFAVPDLGTGERLAFPGEDAATNTGAGPDNRFRTQVVRTIVADPTRPGTVYAAEPMEVLDGFGRSLDSADIRFARSDDHGVTWTRTISLGGGAAAAASKLNDDNGGREPTGSADDVTARQFYTRLAVDEDGNLAAIWYDTRRDPANKNIDVFGAVSTDGGRTFSPNFRVTSATSDTDANKFTDARGADNYHLGDFIGLAVADGTAYAAWTDTRAGNQDVFFSTFAIVPPPAAPNDRFEPNDDAAGATQLGPIVQRRLPALWVGPGDSDVYQFSGRSTGELVVTATPADPAQSFTVELLDAAGTTVLATAAPLAGGAARQLRFPSTAGQAFTLRVTGTAGGGTGGAYALDLQSLTADLGTVAHEVAPGSVGPGDEAYFLLAAAAGGTVQARLAATAGVQDTLVLELLDPQTLGVLATAAAPGEPATATVTQGQQVLVRVTTADATTGGGAFELSVDSLDAFASTDRTSLLFPAGNGPSQIVSGDVNRDGKADLLVSNALSSTVSTLLGNGDGTFQSPRQSAVGAFFPGSVTNLTPLNTFRRDLVLADFNRDGLPDLAVTNNDSADVSILLGRGDGTFEPQRRFDATSKPFALDAGDLNNDGILDLAVIESTSAPLDLAVLIGVGDGTFRAQQLIPTGLPANPAVSDVKAADLDGDGNLDLVYTGSNDQETHVLLGNGDGTFREGDAYAGSGPELALADLDGDGVLDVVNANFYNSDVSFSLGDGDGAFADGTDYFGGQAPVSVAVADLGSPAEAEDGSPVLGPPDGIPDIVSAASGASLTAFQGPPEIVVLPGTTDDDGNRTFAPAVRLASGVSPLSLAIADVNGDGMPEVVFADREGVRVVFDEQPSLPANTSKAAARNLGTVVHLIQPTLTIVPGREEAWYTLRVPTEAARGSRSEVVDFSGLFANTTGAGLDLQVLNARGRVLGSGEHVRVVARQGQQLFVRVFGTAADDGTRGSGAYTLDVAVLPQLLSVDAQPLLPGRGGRPAGPTASIVLTFQGDRLERAAAEDLANYRVTWLGPDRAAGTTDDRVIELAGDAVEQPVVYNPSSNVDISTGREYATAVKQTVTLLFSEALPAGAYQVEVAPAVGAEAFNEAEAALLPAGRHGNVTLRGTRVTDGAAVRVARLVRGAGSAENLDLETFAEGTPFLSQLHGDLGALLDQELTAGGDQSGITGELLQQILARLRAGLGDATSMLAVFLDPVGIDLQDPTGARLTYDLKSGGLENGIGNAFVSVASNVELVVIPLAAGEFTLNVDDVPATARGGVVILEGRDAAAAEPVFLTDRLRAGERTFEFSINPRSTPPTPGPLDGGSGGGGVDLLLPSSLTRRAADVVTGAAVTAAAFMLTSDAIRDDGEGSTASSSPVTQRDGAAESAVAPSGDGGREASIAEGNGEMNGGSDEPTRQRRRAELSPRDVAEQLRKLMNTLPGVIQGVPAEPPAPQADAPLPPPLKDDDQQPSGRGNAERDGTAVAASSSRLQAAERHDREAKSPAAAAATPHHGERSDAGRQTVAPAAGPRSCGAERPLLPETCAEAFPAASVPRPAIRAATTRPTARGGRRRGGPA